MTTPYPTDDQNVRHAAMSAPGYDNENGSRQGQGYPQHQGYAPPGPYQPIVQPNQPGFDSTGKPLNQPSLVVDDPQNMNSFAINTIRESFVHRVYIMVSIQQLITLGCICLMAFHDGTRRFAHGHYEVMGIFLIATIVIMCAMPCLEKATRMVNNILLGSFTFIFAIYVGFLAAVFDGSAWLYSVGLTTSSVIVLTIAVTQTRFHFTIWRGFLYILSVVLVLGSLIAIIVFKHHYGNLFSACFGAALVIALQIAFCNLYCKQNFLGKEGMAQLKQEQMNFLGRFL